VEVINQELGRCLSTKEVAAFLKLDEKTVRRHYRSLGGMRLGRLFVKAGKNLCHFQRSKTIPVSVVYKPAFQNLLPLFF
jgi:hypothetical protein